MDNFRQMEMEQQILAKFRRNSSERFVAPEALAAWCDQSPGHERYCGPEFDAVWRKVARRNFEFLADYPDLAAFARVNGDVDSWFAVVYELASNESDIGGLMARISDVAQNRRWPPDFFLNALLAVMPVDYYPARYISRREGFKLALDYGYVPLIDYLRRRLEFNMRKISDWDLVRAAERYGNWAVADYLIGAGADIDDSTLLPIIAVRQDNVDALKMLASHGLLTPSAAGRAMRESMRHGSKRAARYLERFTRVGEIPVKDR